MNQNINITKCEKKIHGYHIFFTNLPTQSGNLVQYIEFIIFMERNINIKFTYDMARHT